MRVLFLVLGALGPLAACGDGADDLAFTRCKDEISNALGPVTAVAGVAPTGGGLRNDSVYGWHLDVDVRTEGGAGPSGYRCLFVVEGRESPLFLAVVER